MKKLFVVLFVFLLGFINTAFAQNENDALPTRTIELSQQKLQVEVAQTEKEHKKGLMFRHSLPQDHGMLFVYRGPAKVCMWMKNTYIPLSVAFINVDGIIVKIEDMEPQTLTNHCSDNFIRYVLEVNKGWFTQNNIQIGTKINGLPAVKRFGKY